MIESLQVDGLKELDAALKELGVKAGQKVMAGALRTAIKPVYEEVLVSAPKDTGSLLFDGIKIRTKKGKGQSDTLAVARVAINKKYFNRVIAAEFGTIKQKAKPFFRTSFERKWRTSLNVFKTIMKKKLEAEAKKQARIASR